MTSIFTPCNFCVVARTRQTGAGVVGQVGSGGDDLDPVTVEGQPAARHEDQRGDVDEQETATDSEARRSGKSSYIRIQSTDKIRDYMAYLETHQMDTIHVRLEVMMCLY